MGQTQSNCLAFCNELATDDGASRIDAKKRQLEGFRAEIQAPRSLKADDQKQKTEIINIKKLSTQYAIYEEDDEDELSVSTLPKSADTEPTSPNGVKVVAKDGFERRLQMLEELGFSDSKGSTKPVIVGNSFGLNGMMSSASNKEDKKSKRLHHSKMLPLSSKNLLRKALNLGVTRE